MAEGLHGEAKAQSNLGTARFRLRDFEENRLFPQLRQRTEGRNDFEADQRDVVRVFLVIRDDFFNRLVKRLGINLKGDFGSKFYILLEGSIFILYFLEGQGPEDGLTEDYSLQKLRR